MRRGLGFVAVLFVLMGLELSTQGVTLIVSRIGTGVSALLGRSAFHVPGFRFGMGIVLLAGGLALWILLAWSARMRAVVLTLDDGCPHCGNPTRRVRRQAWQRLLAALSGERLTRRRCDTCGWVGLSRGA